MRDPIDRYSDALHKIVQALVRGDNAAATVAATAIAFEPSPPSDRGRSSIRELAEIYERDRYQCRYCGIRTINGAVLPLLSKAFPTQLPMHPNWRGDATHPVYLLQSTTNDHVKPVAWGGDRRDANNIVTACWPCNAAKSDVPLDALPGWRLRDIGEADPTWHGLADLHEPLWTALGAEELAGAAKQWLTASRELYGGQGLK